MRPYIPILLLPMLLFMTTGCIKESRDDCENLSLYFQYLADGDENVLQQYISKMDLYVFDAQENIVGHLTYDQEALNNFAASPVFRLNPGETYTVVALGNAYENTEVVNLYAADLNQIYVQHAYWGSEEPVFTYDHNYLGGKKITIPDGDGVVLNDTVTLYSAHINVEIRLTGSSIRQFNEPAAIMPYRLYIEESNPQINFRNQVIEELNATCSPELIYDPLLHCYRTEGLTLFRLDNNGEITPETCGHELVLRTPESHELIRVSIYRYLEENPSAKEEALLQEANLLIELQDNGQGFEVKVPDWEIEDITPGWES